MLVPEPLGVAESTYAPSVLATAAAAFTMPPVVTRAASEGSRRGLVEDRADDLAHPPTWVSGVHQGDRPVTKGAAIEVPESYA